jgi:EAL domain-containing protein (putative c-di-GMP-specific phosphodiesterase class I)
MATQRKNRREKSDRRSGADRRTDQAPVEVERRKGGQRRTGLERRVELETAGDQIQAALGLLTFAVEEGVLLDVDRWLLETAVARLRLAMEQLGEGTEASPEDNRQ